MLRYIAKEKKRKKQEAQEEDEQAEGNPPDEDASTSIGYSAACAIRKGRMERKGMQTALPPMTADEKKAEKERKKALTSAKHLLK